MRNKRQWILGGIAASLLLIVLILGTSTNYLGALKATTKTKSTTAITATAPATTTTTATTTGTSATASLVSSAYSITSLGDCDSVHCNMYFGVHEAEICWSGTPPASNQAIVIYYNYTDSGGTVVYESADRNFTLYTSVTCGYKAGISVYAPPGFTQGATYTVNMVALDAATSAEIIAGGYSSYPTSSIATIAASSTNKKSYTFTIPSILSIDNTTISSDYETVSTPICNTSTDTTKRAHARMFFEMNGHTEEAYADIQGGECEDISFDTAEFGIEIYAYEEYDLTISVAGTEETDTITILPDIEVRDAGLSENELYAEVCGFATRGDEIGTVRFSIVSADGNFDTLVEDKYAGIGTMPEHNTCETVTVELSNEELESIIENGSYLEAFVEYSIGGGEETNSLNNYFYYYF
ncbi:MAG: hypothetical protein UV80_C0014G0008 [Candidatus Peregrinibacteria bacterium GW2011_GWF2_43_17]|nr:MAG: hypothetical protein UV80_C0014G0008 [Candidatus Peregrinibacteria bacterium GW2011_GWF2_43_17]